jgi:hypothetical protein
LSVATQHIHSWDFLANYASRKTKLWKRSSNKQLVNPLILLMQNLLMAEASRGILLKENESTINNELLSIILRLLLIVGC